MSKDDFSEESFKKAVLYVTKGPAIPGITNQIKLEFYGLFKQATNGQCKDPQPSRLQPVKRMQWQAWEKLGKMSQADARAGYIKALQKLVPEWRAGAAKL